MELKEKQNVEAKMSKDELTAVETAVVRIRR